MLATASTEAVCAEESGWSALGRRASYHSKRTFTCGLRYSGTRFSSPDLVSDQELGDLFLGGNRLD